MESFHGIPRGAQPERDAEQVELAAHKERIFEHLLLNPSQPKLFSRRMHIHKLWIKKVGVLIAGIKWPGVTCLFRDAVFLASLLRGSTSR